MDDLNALSPPSSPLLDGGFFPGGTVVCKLPTRRGRARSPDPPYVPNYPISKIDINPQQISPLFLIPPEIRDAIYAFVFLGTPDLAQPYSHTARSVLPPPGHQFRRSYTHRIILDITLLLTCRRVYFESRHLPLSLNQHAFWPRDFREPIQPSRAIYPVHTAPYLKRLLPWQQRSIVTVRFNLPEPGLWTPNAIRHRLAWMLFKKKTTGLMDPDLDLSNLKTLIWDCHNPIFYLTQNYERYREENLKVNFTDRFELIMKVHTLKEVVLVIDWRPGSKICDYLIALDLWRLKLVDDGSSVIRRHGEKGPPPGYVLRTMRWVVVEGTPPSEGK